MPENQDALDRKGAWIERMFDRLFAAIKESPIGTIAIISVIMNIWQYSIGVDKDAARIADIQSLNEKINAAVEKRVEAKVAEKIAPIQAKQDSTSKAVDTSLINLNGTVESVKQYFNKNKR